MKRKFFSWLILCFVVFAFGTGGCGGSDDDNGSGAGPAHWEDMSGAWRPTEGRVIFYNNSGSAQARFLLSTEGSTSVDVEISGSERLYDVTLSSGTIKFTRSSGNFMNLSELPFQYEEYRGSYTASGATLSVSNTSNGERVRKVIRYVDDDNVTVTVRHTPSSGSTATQEATINFVRAN